MYMLVCCCEREIETPRFFKSWEEAHNAMCADVAATLIVPVEDIKESYLNGEEYDDDTCVIDYSAWAEHHGQNFDWKIFCLDAVPIKQQIVATVEGGVLTGVYADNFDVGVEVIDYDNIAAGDDDALAKMVGLQIETGVLKRCY